jgi:hypothetical protein
MNFTGEIRSAHGSDSHTPRCDAHDEVDVTLRLIAKAPVPPGLEDRVVAGVLAAPRGGRILAWPHSRHAGNWMRNTAAAAIVLVVGGGGWGIYSHVQPREQAAGAMAAPRVVVQPGAFSSAGVVRRPQTVNGPVLSKETSSQEAKVQPTKRKMMNKSVTANKVVKRHDAAAIK